MTKEPDIVPAENKPAKVPARPGSQWATGRRKQQDGYTTKPGFARGAKVK